MVKDEEARLEIYEARLPVYVAIDESYSMVDLMDQLNSALSDLIEQVRPEWFAYSKVRLSVLGFSDDVIWHMELEDVRNLAHVPQLHARSSTSYAAAFEALESRIPEDVRSLKNSGFAVHRPIVLFLSDGQPNAGDEWESAWQSLNQLHARPNIFSFGFGAADPAVIERVATKPDWCAWIASENMTSGAAIVEYFYYRMTSAIASAPAADEGTLEFPIKEPTGFVSLDTGLSRRWRRWFVACLLLTVGALVLVSVILIAYPQMLFGR